VNQFAKLAAFAVLSACAGGSVKPLPAIAAAPKPAVYKLSDKARQSKLVALVFDVPIGTRLGTRGWGWYGGRCSRNEAYVVTQGRILLEHRKYGDLFAAAMKERGYSVEDESEMFRDSTERVADLQVGARIVAATINRCEPKVNESSTILTGSAYLKIEWSVYSTLEKKVIFTATTEGATGPEVQSEIGEPGILRPAFADAAQRLAGSSAYLAIVDPPAAPPADASKVVRVRVHRAKAFGGEMKTNVALIKQAVATVTANRGTGSGFIISDDGIVLTAEHVVSGSKFAKVLTAAGKECYGEVVASSKQRDLAVIRLDCGPLPSLPLGPDKMVEGADVYAVGTPLSDKLQFSVTKGVVSGIRTVDTLEFIQSDVSVLPGNSGGPLLDAHGNVVGVTSGGFAHDSVPLGVNFFIPIGDLTKFLPIDLD
jgi:serine protease Do